MKLLRYIFREEQQLLTIEQPFTQDNPDEPVPGSKWQEHTVGALIPS